MIDLPTTAAVEAALTQPLDADLKRLLEERLGDTVECGLEDLTHVLVVEAEDTPAQIEEAIGFNPLCSRIENRPNSPDWDWRERHGGWWEVLFCMGESGFAYILLIEDDDRSALARACRERNPCA